MRLACPACGRNVKVPESALGKRGRCPGCGEVFALSEELATDAPAPLASQQADREGGIDLSSLAEMEAGAAASSNVCPACDRTLPEQAVLCTACGHDFRTGKKAKAASQPATAPPPPPSVAAGTGGGSGNIYAQNTDKPASRRAAGGGFSGFGLGAAGTFVGAALGAGLGGALYAGVGIFSGYEIGFLAILCGALAGWGAVALNGGQQDPGVGLIAAVVGLAGILGGSYATYHYYIGVGLSEELREEAWEEFRSTARTNPLWSRLNRAELKDRFDTHWAELVKNPPSYFQTLVDSPGDAVMMVLFGLLGLYYGYRVGSGAGQNS